MSQTINSEFCFKPFYDPSVKPQWAQLSRLGGDRVAILFKELRASLGKIDVIVERLHFSGIEDGWVVRYSVGPCEVFTARISPGVLEVKLPADFVEAGKPFKLPQASAALKSAIPNFQSGEPMRIRLTNRAMVRSFSNLAAARVRFFSKAGQ